MTTNPNPADQEFMREAHRLAKKGFDEGGIPIGSVLVRGGKVVALPARGGQKPEGPLVDKP